MTTEISTARTYREILSQYHQIDRRRSWIQVLNSFVPFLLLRAAMIQSLRYSYMLTLLLALQPQDV